jgi:Ribosomal protein L11 methyltransferase (PrmA)
MPGSNTTARLFSAILSKRGTRPSRPWGASLSRLPPRFRAVLARLEITVSLIVDEHRQYLRDAPRLAAFERAVAEVVKPGDVVVDLASGTGILGLLACRAGAARVYSIDAGGIIETAREVARANGFGDRVCFIKGFSTHVDLPEKADVVVADQIGNFGFNAGVLEYFADARARFLKPEGVTLPTAIDLVLAPCESSELYNQIEFWNSKPAGFDFQSVRPLAANTGYRTMVDPECMIGAPDAVMHFDLNHASTALAKGQTTLTVTRPGTLHGLVGWFTARLSGGVTMSNSPLAPDRINRRQVFFPIDRPETVMAGDIIKVTMMIRPTELVVNWTVDVTSAGGNRRGRYQHSTWKGMLLNQEDLRRTLPQSKPRLTARGEGRRSVVELCDGARALADIEEEVFRRHPNLFRTRAQAAAFVAEVVTRYAE